MKPKFALDLSHEGINLLHRSKGGWTLVGSVPLDDSEMGPHLAALRRKAAELESGGFTTKIIIPNSQILYTTIEAPGPDDIAREVQIRSGLDGLTPYPVGELVFDWRAAGEKARVAVLARDTMDEAETFAVEHKFNPVSFVARPTQGEFSGEPFFGKTRAATKILGPTERVEPDASPVPRRAPASPKKAPASGAVSAAVAAAAAAMPEPGQQPGRQPGRPRAPQDSAPPVPEPLDMSPPEPQRPAPAKDDPFAELDAIQAELSGDLSAARPAAQPQSSRRGAAPARATEQSTPPPLAPFPPTSDEAGKKPAAKPARKPRSQPKPAGPGSAPPPQAARPAPAASARPPERDAPPTRSWTPPTAENPARPEGTPPRPRPEDDIPPKPGVSFSTRRGSGTTATPTARQSATAALRQDSPAKSAPPSGPTEGTGPKPPSQPAAREARKAMSPNDRHRADMADALSRPLPGSSSPKEPPSQPAEASTRSSISGAMRGAAGGLRSLNQRRADRKADRATSPAPDQPSAEAQPAPESRPASGQTGSSMEELMRGAGASDARITPAARADEPDLLAPGLPAADGPRKDPDAAARKPAQPSGPAATAPAKTRATPPKQATLAPGAEKPAKPAVQTSPAKPAAKPAAPRPDRPKVQAKPATPATAAKPATEPTGLDVFGAQSTPERTGGRRYLGLLLTLLLVLVMAIIAFWSNFFVDDGAPQFNPGDNPPAETTTPETEPTADPVAPVEADPAPVEDSTPAPDQDPVPEADPAAEPETTSDTSFTPQVLTPEEAEARYSTSGIWQRAPEPVDAPSTPGLDMGEVGGPGRLRAAPGASISAEGTDAPTEPPAVPDRAEPLPPPPADTLFDLDATGLVTPSPEGTVSPTGVLVFEGPPSVVPPTRPEAPAPELTPDPTAAPDTTPADPDGDATDATDAAVLEALQTPLAPPDVPDIRPLPRPEDLPAVEAPAPDAPETGTDTDTDPTDPAADGPDDARLVPEELPVDDIVDTAASLGDDAVEAAATIVNASELAVATSIKPTGRPANIDAIAAAATAAAAAAPPIPVAAPAVVTPSIPTAASVADQATAPNAINLREINLLGIFGPANGRSALIRLTNGRTRTVSVGDRLDGGRVTSISDNGLTYQKGSRNISLQLLPL